MRQSERRQAAHRETSTYDEKEKREMELAAREEEERRQEKLRKQEEIKQSSEYQLVEKVAFLMDKCFLDPILGFFMPELGDFITSLTVLPSIYVSMFVIRSIPLTLAVISNTMMDTLIGMVPFIGDIADIFYRSNVKNYTLITGYVEEDEEIISSVNKRAVWTAVFIAIMGYLLYLLWQLFHALIVWTTGLVSSCIDSFTGMF